MAWSFFFGLKFAKESKLHINILIFILNFKVHLDRIIRLSNTRLYCIKYMLTIESRRFPVMGEVSLLYKDFA